MGGCVVDGLISGGAVRGRRGRMRALTVVPKQAKSARVEEVPEPPDEVGPVLVEVLAIGVCGTDLDIVNGNYGWAPPGRDRLILGHESLGRVREAPAGCGLAAGD